MADDATIYKIEIEVNGRYLTQAARDLIPKLIRQFGTSMVVKTSLVSGDKAVRMRATVEGPDTQYLEQTFDLSPSDT